MERKKGFSKAESKFRDYIKKTKPYLQVTKKGFPDFALINNGEIVGFVEVKRDDINDVLKEEQELFRDFCRKHDIPYQVWSPVMASEYWKTAGERFKRGFAYGGEIWEKI